MTKLSTIRRALFAATGLAAFAAGASVFAASAVPQPVVQGDVQAPAAVQPAAKTQAQDASSAKKPGLPPPLLAQNYYLKSGKFFGSSRLMKDQSGATVIVFYDAAGRIAGTGKPYIGKESGNNIVKYYDKGGKYLGYSTAVTDPDGESRATYKMAAGIVFGTSVTRIDKAANDYVTTYYYASGKLAGTSRRAGAKPQAAQAARTQPQDSSATASTSAAASTATATTTATSTPASSGAPASNSNKSSGSVTYVNSGDSPVLVPASRGRR